MSKYNEELIAFTQELIRKESVTPKDDGAIALVADFLSRLGSSNKEIIGSDPDADEVLNLYAELNPGPKMLGFAGHTDVVPTGEGWSSPPFAAEIIDGTLIGRGAVDMKSAICAFLIAVKEIIEVHNITPSLAFLITGNEEGVPTNGTLQILKYFKEQNKKMDLCLVGEPTSEEKIGDTIKIGRRGSINFILTIEGVQGHVAYPHKAQNPITTLTKILNLLLDTEFDNGSEFFSATNLEITNITVNNEATNVIPGSASAGFNIRFNDNHTSKTLIEAIEMIVSKTADKYNLEHSLSGESFITNPGDSTDHIANAIAKHTGINTKISTSGGTSDARFIKDYCPVIEFGLLNKTAHHIDEHVLVNDLKLLKDIYKEFLLSYFA